MLKLNLPVYSIEFEKKEPYSLTIQNVTERFENVNIKMKCLKASYFNDIQTMEFSLISQGFIDSFRPQIYWMVENRGDSAYHVMELRENNRIQTMMSIYYYLVYLLFGLGGFCYWLQNGGLFILWMAPIFKYILSIIEYCNHSISCKYIEKIIREQYFNTIVYIYKEKRFSLKQCCWLVIDSILLLWSLLVAI